jgi:hypothetical protein
MTKIKRIITFVLLGLLFIFEIFCLIFNLIIFRKSCDYKYNETTKEIISINILLSSIGIFINTINIFIIFFYGLHSLYFKIKYKINLYLI